MATIVQGNTKIPISLIQALKLALGKTIVLKPPSPLPPPGINPPPKDTK